ncbi:MAG: ATP-grasp domain-containing protein, partial [Candidatus Promineifilaceae bacterium]
RCRPAAAAGFLTPAHTLSSFGPKDLSQIEARAAELGYPLIIKSCSGGRGRGERLALRPQALAEAVRQAQAVSQAVYGNSQIYMEKAILPACQVGVQIVADGHGNLIHLGEREGSVLLRGMKIVEETPARCLSTQQRAELWQTAVDLARLFNYQGVGTVEFLVDPVGKAYFTEIKARIQVEHALTEMLARIDLVREQIHIAAGEALSLVQEEVSLNGWAMMARVRANDPWQDNMPSPGPLQRLRLPGGPEVRVDTYVYCQAEVPAEYDPLLANLTVWGATREQSLARLQRALEEFIIMGTASNLPVLQLIATHPRFVDGSYSTGLQIGLQKHPTMPYPNEHLRDLAAAAAILFLRRYQKFDPQPPPRFAGGWHKSSRRLPQ